MASRTIALTITSVAALYVFSGLISRQSKYNKPPGPKPWPLIGNILDFPTTMAWLTYSKWREQYGNIVYLDLLGHPMVVLNSLEDCTELLEKRSAKYSDRPRSIMTGDLMGWDFNFGLMSYSTRWRRHRRLFHQHFTENACVEYHAIQRRTSYHLLQRLLDNPEQFLDHIRLAFGETILAVMYDIQVQSHDDAFVQNAEKAMESALQAAIPGHFLVDVFPILNYVPSWFPGAGFKRQAASWRKIIAATRDLTFTHVMEETESGNAKPSVLTSMLDMAARDGTIEGETAEEAARGCAAVAYTAGGDTTLAAIQAMFMVMANNPIIQKEAQKELDRVIGEACLPTFEDRLDLPYISAIVKELLRWHNVGPLGLPHVLSENDEYRGYVFPKGTMFVGNIWYIMHDPEVFHNPMEFDPMRWLLDTPQGQKLNPDTPDITTAFGFGRRGCPGRHFALDSLFITVATVLSCFNITPLDANGGPAEKVKEEFTDGLVSYPVPFRASIVPRSTEVAKLIRELDS